MSNVSLAHEAPLEVLRQSPGAILDLLQVVGGKPRGKGALTVELQDSELTEAKPSARQADLVALLRDEMGRVRRVVIVEIQRGRDDAKLFAWPLYVAYLHAQHQTRVTLLVVTFDAGIAKWARKRRSLGTHFVFAPLVLGPDDLPEIASVDEAFAHPELSVLTALARNSERDPTRLGRHDEEVVRVCEATLRMADSRLRRIYLSLLHGTARAELRAILQKRLEEHGMGALEIIRAEGQAEGQANALLTVLRARGIHVDDVASARVRETRDLAVLDRWLERAVTATTIAEVLA